MAYNYPLNNPGVSIWPFVISPIFHHPLIQRFFNCIIMTKHLFLTQWVPPFGPQNLKTIPVRIICTLYDKNEYSDLFHLYKSFNIIESYETGKRWNIPNLRSQLKRRLFHSFIHYFLIWGLKYPDYCENCDKLLQPKF